jgi:hypothetical protein
MAFFLEWLSGEFTASMIDPFVLIPGALIGYLVPHVWMRLTLALIVGALLSTFAVSILERATAILPSDATAVWLAACLGRGAVGWMVAEIIGRVARRRIAG